MDRHVPRFPECVDVVRVPPVAVEVSIGEMQQLADQVQERVENQVEEAQPDQMVRYLQKYTRNERACKKKKRKKEIEKGEKCLGLQTVRACTSERRTHLFRERAQMKVTFIFSVLYRRNVFHAMYRSACVDLC